METFGCCSSYLECSEEKKCLYFGEANYEGCRYRTNLEAGRIFYGRNATDSMAKPIEDMTKKEYFLYLACYNQLFAVLWRHKNTYSYNLSGEQFQKLTSEFDKLNIPYKTEFEQMEPADIAESLAASPSNSRIYFTLEGEKFNIYCHNAYLMKEYYANKICKALQAKGIEASVEIFHNKNSQQTVDALPVAKASMDIVKPKNEKPEIKPLCFSGKTEQISMFEYLKVIGG